MNAERAGNEIKLTDDRGPDIGVSCVHQLTVEEAGELAEELAGLAEVIVHEGQ